MYIPGFDPKTFSDDELFNKQMDIQRKLSMTGNMEALNQLQLMNDAINAERRERIFAIGQQKQSDPTILETEPDLKKEPEKVNLNRSTGQTRPKIFRVNKTSSPTNDDVSIPKRTATPEGN